MASKSKVLVIGATGGIGQHIALAGPAQGHSTFALVRSTSALSSSKASLIDSFKAAGISILEGSLEDHGSLVAAIKQVDVVICAVGPPNTLDQLKIIKAIKEVGTIKTAHVCVCVCVQRFLPSEFGNDVDRLQVLEPAKTIFGLKVQVRRAIEEAGIPYTYVVSNCFAGYFSFPNPLQPGVQSPPRDKVSIYGSGDVKFIVTLEDDVGAYTMKAVDDSRTLNKILHIRPAANIVTMNSLVELWENLIGKTLEKVTLTEEDMVKQIQETPFPQNAFLAVLHGVVIQGDQCNFELGSKDVEATTLYPDHKNTWLKEYFTRFV